MNTLDTELIEITCKRCGEKDRCDIDSPMHKKGLCYRCFNNILG